jgi:hypothetical protein
MRAPYDTTTPSRSEQVADPTRPPARNVASIWARGRRQITPWAYPRLRALAAVRFAVGIFLVGLSALMLSRGNSGWVALPLAGAALNLSIAYLDITVARSVPLRT